MRRTTATILLLVWTATPAAFAAGVLEWSQVGPEGGVVWTLGSDPDQPDRLFAAPLWGVRLYLSTDRGTSWTPGGTGLESVGGIYGIAAAGSTVYVASRLSGVLRSDEGGLTFVASGGPSPEPCFDVEIERTAGEPQATAPLWAATAAGGVFRSTDGGTTWEARNAGLSSRDVQDLALDPADASILYAATSGVGEVGIFRSIDAGASWQPAGNGLTATSFLEVEADPLDPKILYASGAEIDPPAVSWQVYRSTDSAASWERIDTGLPSLWAPSVETDGSTVWVASLFNVDSVFRSVDGGQSWDAGPPISAYGLTTDLHSPAPGEVFAAVGGDAVSRSTDGGVTWKPAGRGIMALSVQALTTHPLLPGQVYAGTDVGTLFHSADEGGSWQTLAEGLSPYNVTAVAIEPGEPPTLWLATSWDGVFRSLDGGGTWEPANAGLAELAVTDLERDGGVLWAGTTRGVFQSFDDADSWQPASQGLGDAYVEDLTITPSAAWAATISGLFRSLDGGQSWSAPPDPPEESLSKAVIFDPAEPSRLWAAAGEQVFRSTDGGGSWAPDDLGLDGGFVQSLHLDPGSRRLLAGTSEGVFERRSGGWVRSPSTVADVIVEAFASSSGGSVFAGTVGASVLRGSEAAILFCDGFESGDTGGWSAVSSP